MSELYIGAYWKARKLTMREYADSTKKFLQALCKFHPVFNELYDVGSKPNSEVKLMPDFENLDDLIYRNCWNPKAKYENSNPDGSPSWDTDNKLGFGMIFNSGKVPEKGGVRVSIHTGSFSPALTNAVLIYFPPPNHPNFPHPEFHQNESIERLFRLAVNFWKPESALLTSRYFGKKVDFESTDAFRNNYRIGLFTYLENTEVIKELPSDVDYHRLEAGGTMFVTSREILSMDTPEQVEKAVKIRDHLYQKGLLKKGS